MADPKLYNHLPKGGVATKKEVEAIDGKFKDYTKTTDLVTELEDTFLKTEDAFDGKYDSLEGTPDLTKYATTESLNDYQKTADAFDGKFESLTGVEEGLKDYAKSADVAKDYLSKTDASNTYATQQTVSQLSTTVDGKLGKEEAAGIYAKSETVTNLTTTVSQLSSDVESKASQAEVDSIKSTIASSVSYQGSVEAQTDLTAKEATAKKGDMWNVVATDMNYVWNGTSWDPMAGMFDASSIESEIADIKSVLTEIKIAEATLTATWTGDAGAFTQNVAIPEALAGTISLDVELTNPAQEDAYAAANIKGPTVSNGNLVFTCPEQTAPATAFGLSIRGFIPVE